MGYFKRIYEVSKSILVGMNVTLKHLLTPKTITTRQYVGLRKPRPDKLSYVVGRSEKYHDKDELEPQRYYREGLSLAAVKPLDYIPDRHRGLHYLETEKCIMCFQCSRACPVDCIDIEGTRNGHVDGAHRADKVILTRFSIDYSLCIFCDHCTIACPDHVKCIHMGPEFDFASYDQSNLVKNLLTDAPLTKEDRDFILEARKDIDRLAAEKAAARKAAAAAKKAKKAAKAKAKKTAGGTAKKTAAKKTAAKKTAAKKAARPKAGKTESGAGKKPTAQKAARPKTTKAASDTGKKAEAQKAEAQKAEAQKAEANKPAAEAKKPDAEAKLAPEKQAEPPKTETQPNDKAPHSAADEAKQNS